jgi:hypothetical protein
LFVADNPEPGAWFPLLTDSIIAQYLPPDLEVQRAYLAQTIDQTVTPADIVRTRTAISDALQSGVWLVQYSGHGSITSWATEQIWRASDVPGLHNGDRLPVVMTFNCLDGYFAYPGQPSIAELMQRQNGGGSVAAIASSSLGLTLDQHALRQLLMQVIFHEGVRELGRALLLAKQRYYALYGPNYMLATMMVFGDPAMRLPLGISKHYLPLTLKR